MRGASRQILISRPRPSLDLRFDFGQALDSRITFTRASSATRFDSSGTLVTMTTDQPRFDYDPVTLAAKGLLIEEARTNLVLQSETLQTTWSPAASSVSANATVAPDGATTGDKLVEDSATSTHAIQQFLAYADATAYTLTGYFKAAERSWCWMFFPAAAFTATSGAYFNLGAGTVGSTISTGVTATIQAIGNGWYRCAITKTSTAAASGNTGFGIATGDNVNSYAGNGTSGISAWGLQLEAGAFPTSYIPTTGASATRAADVATITTLTPWFNASEGTILAEGGYADAPIAGANRFNGLFALNDATANNFIGDGLRVVPGASARDFSPEVWAGGVLQAAFDSANINENAAYKVAVAYKANDCCSALSGTLLGATDTSVTIPTLTQLQLGVGRGSAPLNGHIKRLAYYPRRLSNTQLQILTA